MKEFFHLWHQWILFLGTLVGVLIGVLVAHALIFRLVKRLRDRDRKYMLLYALRQPLRVVLAFVVLLMLLPAMPVNAGIKEAMERALDLSLIGCAAWTFIALLGAFEDMLTLQYRIDVADNLLARRIRTRLQVFHHITVGVVIVVTLAVALMTFPNVRSLGASLLASAGLAGIIAGMASRPALSNLIAGLQIAITEPIRLEDVVIIENEWGWIEEIDATYVVVRLWDLRRMILPLSYFIEHPFQNWTRRSANLMGTVVIHVDFGIPVDAMRQELTRILKGTPLWLGKVNVLQVTDSDDHSMQLRALFDAADSGKLWDLRCLVREKLIDFVQSRHPDALPQTRITSSTDGHQDERVGGVHTA